MPQPSSTASTEDWDPWRAWSSRWWAMWQPPSSGSATPDFVPQSLVQPILPGWAIGNVIVNERNSASPETERDITAEVSYGRQLGKVIDALAAMIAERPGGVSAAGGNEALRELLELRTTIESTKQASVERRVARLESDLLWLKERQPRQFERIAALLMTNRIKDRK
jgi:hypothetical protein